MTAIYHSSCTHFIYLRDGKVQSDPEVLLRIKTTCDQYEALYPNDLKMQLGDKVGIVNPYGDRRYTRSNVVVMSHALYQSHLLIMGCLIMAGHILVSKSSSQMPWSLAQTIVGKATAKEINWLSEDK